MPSTFVLFARQLRNAHASVTRRVFDVLHISSAAVLCWGSGGHGHSRRYVPRVLPSVGSSMIPDMQAARLDRAVRRLC